jgi:sec-independent protein translocase protein TatA
MIPSVGPTELIILLAIILLLFGAKRIPELARGLGTGIREFKKGTSGEAEKDEVHEKEKEGALAGEVGEDTHNARMKEEATREERTEQTAKRAEQNL